MGTTECVSVFVRVGAYASVHVNLRLRAHTYSVCTSVCESVRVRTCACVCVRTCMCVPVCALSPECYIVFNGDITMF